MSDFLFCSAPRPPGLLRDALARYLDPVTAEYQERHGAWGSLAVARAPHDGVMLVEDARGVSVLAGEPIVRAPGGEPGSSGTASRRAAVHDLLCEDGEVPWGERLDGPFAALHVDPERGGGTVVTDLMSFIPVFAATARDGGGGLVVGTHVDAVARAAGRDGELDPVSLADLLANLSVTFPHTAYHGVEQLAPAASHRFGNGGGATARPYWLPAERDVYPSLSDAAAALRAGILEDVRHACGHLPEVGLLLSAGEDSRAVLGAVPPGVGVRAVVFSDRENREVQIARRVARAYGAEFAFGRRDADHYLGSLEPVAAVVGSHQLFADVHGYGFHRSLGLDALPAVLGGFSADSLLKGEYAPDALRRGARLRPRAVLAGVREELVREALARRYRHREEMRELRPESAGEWMHLWPFSMRKHAANLHGHRRLFRAHEPFHANAVVRLAADVPLRWKRRRRLFHAAVRPLLARSWYVPHGKARFPYFGPYGNVLLGTGLGAVRGVHAALTGAASTNQKGWPRAGTLVRSELMERRLIRYFGPGSPLRELFEPAERARALERVRQSWSPLPQLVLLQLAYLLHERR